MPLLEPAWDQAQAVNFIALNEAVWRGAGWGLGRFWQTAIMPVGAVFKENETSGISDWY
ncbi:hypothetical protein [Primorskyibacter sp. S187A]|uniref:hypothetical protein n=1 Tax=Primorskyibacter sp. S187A TaxID=3415130 RepID=UPI003C7D32FE